MILLVTASARASECAAALNEATREEVVVAESLHRAATLLRKQCYLAVVLDQHLVEAGPKDRNDAESVFECLGTAVLVQVNLAISGVERLVREVRASVQRRQREEVRARQAALGRLNSELNDTVTALLLSSELALGTSGLPPAASEKLRSVHELVEKLRRQLMCTSLTEASEVAAGV
jgi:hypothetical protein